MVTPKTSSAHESTNYKTAHYAIFSVHLSPLIPQPTVPKHNNHPSLRGQSEVVHSEKKTENINPFKNVFVGFTYQTRRQKVLNRNVVRPNLMQFPLNFVDDIFCCNFSSKISGACYVFEKSSTLRLFLSLLERRVIKYWV